MWKKHPRMIREVHLSLKNDIHLNVTDEYDMGLGIEYMEENILEDELVYLEVDDIDKAQMNLRGKYSFW